jgi:hypothetical protein
MGVCISLIYVKRGVVVMSEENKNNKKGFNRLKGLAAATFVGAAGLAGLPAGTVRASTVVSKHWIGWNSRTVENCFYTESDICITGSESNNGVYWKEVGNQPYYATYSSSSQAATGFGIQNASFSAFTVYTESGSPFDGT